MSTELAKWGRSERVCAGLVSAAVVGATLWPLRQYLRPQEDRVDGFPLSYYPMFSAHRSRYGDVAYAVGVRRDGSRFNLPYTALGTGGVNQVRKQLFRAVAKGQVEAHARLLAVRVAARPECADVVRVEIVHGCFDLDACLLEGRTQGEETVLAGVDVPRAESGCPAPSESEAVAS